MRKAKNANPWTKKKLHAQRLKREKMAPKMDKKEAKEKAKESAAIDRVLEGCS